MVRSWILGLAPLKTIALVLVAFAAISAHSPAGAAEKFRVILDWFVNPDHAPLFVALEKGYFAERGLDVELIAPTHERRDLAQRRSGGI